MMESPKTKSPQPIERFFRPFYEFAKQDTAGGILLLGCTLLALLWANSPWAASYFQLWHTKVGFNFAGLTLSEPLHVWINDGLMALFFLLVGLEIKRETLAGELASFRSATLPIAGALGGMVVPASIYWLFNHDGSGRHGWGIPVATDIAFALGILALLGKRIPSGLRVFLAALAIADDIGAVLIIAFFYTDSVSAIRLLVAGLCFTALIVCNIAGARHALIYSMLGVILWFAFLHSGIHPTVGGVLLAMTIPAGQRIDGPAFLAHTDAILDEFRDAEGEGQTIHADARGNVAVRLPAENSEQTESPMLRFEHALAPWVMYLVMPLFALANAGVALGSESIAALVSPISLGVICGLALGKPIGIVLFSWGVTRRNFSSLPTGVRWRQILGAGALGGIGFTMSLFVADLAFGPTSQLEAAKIGILVASLVSGVTGALILLKKVSATVSDPFA